MIKTTVQEFVTALKSIRCYANEDLTMDMLTKDKLFAECIQRLTVITEHLSEGALYPGGYIFEENAPCVDVLKRLLRRIKRASK